MTSRRNFSRILLHTVLLATSLIMAYPLIFGMLASFMTQEAYQSMSFPWLPIPTEPTLVHYQRIFNMQTNVPRWIFNTVVRIVWYCVVPGTIAVWCGYVFARLQFKGRDTVFVIILASMMIPAIVYAIPTYIMMARFPLAGGNDLMGQGGHGFIGEWPSLLLPTLVNAYFIFLMRQTFWSIPNDFEEAARIDGANTLQVMRHVYLPMILPAITVMVIFQSVAVWNDYLWPLLTVASNEELWPLALGFQRAAVMGSQVKGLPYGMGQNYPFVFMLATVALLPIVALFFWLQKYFVEGVQGFAIKG
ncbi:MAG: carbohydrate ABC transporter permease [Candidatus Promineifilaceae bacterium]